VNIDVTETPMKIDAERLKSWTLMGDLGKSMKMRETCLTSQRIIGELS
jgi:hypothetical protein